jgi:hypothetical protein
MVSHLFYDPLALVARVWLFVMLHGPWPKRGLTPPPASAQPEPLPPKRMRADGPKPFAGLTPKPPGALGERDPAHPPAPPPVLPAPRPPTHRRPRTMDTSRPFCPHTAGDGRGWLGLHNLRAHGQPRGGPWRPLHCLGCNGYVPEHHGTLLPGKQASGELIVHVLACLAEGRGIRATARVFEVEANPVLQWLVAAADQRRAFSRAFLCDVHVEPCQLDELDAGLRDLKAGESNEDEASERLERSPAGVWTALAPQRKWLLVLDVGPRTLEMAQRGVHQVTRRVAPGWVPRCMTDGLQDDATALRTHCGPGRQPQRRQDQGPMPQPRWMPRPARRYAQVGQWYRRRRRVGGTPRVGGGPQMAIEQGLAAGGWPIQTAFVERLNLDLRQRGAASGRRVNTLCQGAAGWREQWTRLHVYHNCVLPHARRRQPGAAPAVTNSRGAAQRWRPCTPAMAAGLTDHVGTLPAVLLDRGPAGPQPQLA